MRIPHEVVILWSITVARARAGRPASSSSKLVFMTSVPLIACYDPIYFHSSRSSLPSNAWSQCLKITQKVSFYLCHVLISLFFSNFWPLFFIHFELFAKWDISGNFQTLCQVLSIIPYCIIRSYFCHFQDKTATWKAIICGEIFALNIEENSNISL